MSATEPRTRPEPPAALSATTLCEAFQRTVAERPDQVALRTLGGDVEITFGEAGRRVRAIAAGLWALGVRRGDSVALMMTNRPEFHLVDAAAFHLGATPFSVYNTSSPEQIAYLFSNASNRVVVCESQFADIVQTARGDAPTVEHVVVLDGDAEQTMTLEVLEASGDPSFDLEEHSRAVEPGDVLTLIYTSGTTGPPKGVQLTHANMMAEIQATTQVLPTTAGGRTTSYLPSAHIADRWMSHYKGLIVMGFTITSVPDPRQIAAALPAVRPTAWGAVPRIWEKFMAALQAQGVTDPAGLDEAARAAVRAKLGLDEVEWLISGAAPIATEVLEFFLALGLPICELWGMSETSCCVAINPPHDIRIGTVGVALPGTTVKLADDNELLIGGPLVMKGYRNEPEKTADAIRDGWMYTGDIGEIDADGYIKIVDRKKEIIINAAGKNMSPANIEQRLKASSPLIGQAICIGDRRPYNVALLVLDPDAGAQFAKEHSLDDSSPAVLRAREDVQAEVARGVEAANAQLSRVEQIKRFEILGVDWEPGGDELTPTMKLKRKPIHEKYGAEIEGLYGG